MGAVGVLMPGLLKVAGVTVCLAEFPWLCKTLLSAAGCGIGADALFTLLAGLVALILGTMFVTGCVVEAGACLISVAGAVNTAAFPELLAKPLS